MGNKWVGTRWRSVSVKIRTSDGTIYPGDDFVFTQEMTDKGCVPDMWIEAGNAVYIPEGVTLPPAPKDSDAPPAAGDAEPAAPVGRRKKDRHAWLTSEPADEVATADDVLVISDEEAPDDSNAWS